MLLKGQDQNGNSRSLRLVGGEGVGAGRSFLPGVRGCLAWVMVLVLVLRTAGAAEGQALASLTAREARLAGTLAPPTERQEALAPGWSVGWTPQRGVPTNGRLGPADGGALAPPAARQTNHAPSRVLLLQSFGREVAPFNVAAAALKTTLAKELGRPVDLQEIALNVARVGDSSMNEANREYLTHHVNRYPPDLVIALGSPAAQFVIANRGQIFGEIPVLFTAVDPRFVPAAALHNATLVTQGVDLRRAVEEMLQLRPETTNIVMVLGHSALERVWAAEARKAFEVYTNRIGFSYLNELSLEQMEEVVSNLPRNSFVFHGMLVMDAAQVPYEREQGLRELHQVANAPIYGLFQSQLGLGIVGGRLFQEETVGQEAARVGIRVLGGEAIGSMAPRIIESPQACYDWRELQRWGIPGKRLPAGSRIEFSQPSFLEQYAKQIAAVLGLTLLQTVLIIGLAVNRSRRKQSEAAATLIAELSSRFVHLPTREVDRQIEAALRRVCEHLGIERSTVWQWEAAPRTLRRTHLYQQNGKPWPGEGIQGEELFPWASQELLAGRVVKVTRLEELPGEAANDRGGWEALGVKSTLVFPLSRGSEEVFGAVGFNSMRKERRWHPPLVNQLQTVAQIIAHALARKRADQELHESEERLSLATESAGVGLWKLELATRRFWLTKRTRELFNLEAEEPLDFEGFLARVQADDRAVLREALRRALEMKAEVQVEYRVPQADGSMRWIHSRGRVHCDAQGVPGYLIGVSSNITERKRTEEALRGLSARLISTQEKERARLARELHDDITQRLARLAIDVARCEAAPASQATAETARQVRDGLVRLSEDVHALSYRLHPSIIEDLGLAAALKAEAQRFANQGNISVEVKVADLPEPIPPDAALCLFRVAQEAMRNAVRHARAKAIKISLRCVDEGLQLAVQDDGDGFEPSGQKERQGLGLASMQERVHLSSGELEIESEPGHGTTILAWVPRNRNAP